MDKIKSPLSITKPPLSSSRFTSSRGAPGSIGVSHIASFISSRDASSSLTRSSILKKKLTQTPRVARRLSSAASSLPLYSCPTTFVLRRPSSAARVPGPVSARPSSQRSRHLSGPLSFASCSVRNVTESVRENQ